MNTYTHIVRHYHPQPYHHHSQLKSYEFDLISTIYSLLKYMYIN